MTSDFKSGCRPVVYPFIGLICCAVLTVLFNGCNRTSAAKTTPGTGPCAIALAAHQGGQALDAEIRRLQQKIKENLANMRPQVEQLGWKFVEKARRSYDPGFYKLAEQCAACLEQLTVVAAQPTEPTKVKNADALLLRGHVLHNLHQFTEAETVARTLSTQRGIPFDHALLGDVLLEQGRLDEAAAAYQKFMDLKPGLQAYLRAAQLRWLKGDLDGAIEMALQALRASSTNEPEAAAWAAAKLAFYDLHAGKLVEARDACAVALKFMPDYAPALLLRGRVDLAEGKYLAAQLTFQQAARLNPLPEYQWALSEALRALGRHDEAQQIEAELKATGALEDPRTFALFLATRNDDTVQALRLTEAELKNRQDVFTLDAAAWALAQAGRAAAAQPLLQRALATGIHDARLAFHAAVIAKQLNQLAEARRHVKQALSMKQTLLPVEYAQLLQLKL